MRLKPQFATTLGVLCCLAGCGGGAGAPASPPAGEPLLSARIAAATATAASATNACATIRPFHWQIGSREQVLASGSLSSPTSSLVYMAATVLPVASASKWLYAAYYVQRSQGTLSAEDVKFLTFRSGYTSFKSCEVLSTVGSCLEAGTNGAYTAAHDGLFFYDGGHMQKHAVLRGLGPLANRELADEIRSQLGTDVQFVYSQPQLAGGVAISAEQYAKVLRRMLAGELRIGNALGVNAVCASPRTCPGQAVFSPAPRGETWHYSIGHWVEDDPLVGDGAFSSPGLFGFYPWIDRSKSWYGIVARVDEIGAIDSVDCGRLIRKSWVTVTPQ